MVRSTRRRQIIIHKGNRALTLDHVRKLGQHFKVSTAIFVGRFARVKHGVGETANAINVPWPFRMLRRDPGRHHVERGWSTRERLILQRYPIA